MFRIQYANKAAERLFDVKVVRVYLCSVEPIASNEIPPMYSLLVCLYFFTYHHMLKKQLYSNMCVHWNTISTKEEILSRPLADVTHLDSQCIRMAASMNTEFDIKLPSVKRKSSMDASPAVATNCHFVAVTCVGRKPTHFLITFGVTSNNNILMASEHSCNNLETLSQMQSSASFSIINTVQSQPPQIPKQNNEPRGSLHGSIRRGMVS